MNIRNKLAAPSTIEQVDNVKKIPSWVSSGSLTTQRLYHAVEEEFAQISSSIKARQANTLKERKLVPARIAARANLDRSNIHPRRQLELCHWIESKNRELENLFNLYKPHRTPSKSMSKTELQDELSRIRAHSKEQTEAERRAIVEEYFNSKKFDDRDKLQRENSHLKQENATLRDKVARLQITTNENNQFIASLLSLLSPEQRSKLYSISIIPDEKKSLK